MNSFLAFSVFGFYYSITRHQSDPTEMCITDGECTVADELVPFTWLLLFLGIMNLFKHLLTARSVSGL